MQKSEELELAIKATLKAGKVIMQIYESEDFEIELKGDSSPLTKADTAAHEVIKSFLSTSSLPLLSEEGAAIPYAARKNWNRFWLVDPIDGTKEFSSSAGSRSPYVHGRVKRPTEAQYRPMSARSPTCARVEGARRIW